MERKIRVFKSFEEQEKYFLEYFVHLTPSERLRSLADLQRKNYREFSKPTPKKITVTKHYFANGY